MPDPVSSTEAFIGGAMAVQTVKSAVGRVVGPSVDEVGEAFRRWTGFRLRNVGRIAEAAERKSESSGRAGEVPPRVVHRLLEEGSYCDDELMAEYLGGVLAASRTPGGRDDRAVAWSDLVTGLSTVQVRGHFLLYREWAALLRGHLQFNVTTRSLEPNLGVDEGRNNAVICVSLLEFSRTLMGETAEEFEGDVLAHVIPGLVRQGLLEAEYGYGPRHLAGVADAPFDPILTVRPSVAGMELYGWAQGAPGLAPTEFVASAEVMETEPALPRLATAYLPRMPIPPVERDASGSSSAPVEHPDQGTGGAGPFFG